MLGIDLSHYGSFSRDEYAIGTTSKNTYYPLYSQLENQRIGQTQYMYYKPNLDALHGISRYNELFNDFRSKLYFSRFNFVSNDDNHFILVMKGYIANHLQQPLLMIGVSDYNNDLTIYDEAISDETKAKLKVFVATELLNNDIYSNIWRKIDREFIQGCYQEGITVEFCTIDKIEKTFFSNEFVLEYNNLTELNNHLKNNVAPLLFEEFPVTWVDSEPTETLNLSTENIVFRVGSNLSATTISGENIITFIEQYYMAHGSLPEYMYVKHNGNVVFKFASGINHMFEPQQMINYIQGVGYTPIPVSVEGEEEHENIPPHIDAEEQDYDVLESSITDVLVSDVPITEEQLRFLIRDYQSTEPSGVRMVVPASDDSVEFIFGNYSNHILSTDTMMARLDQLGFISIYSVGIDPINESAEEYNYSDRDYEEGEEEQENLDDDFVLVDDTENVEQEPEDDGLPW